MLRTPPALTAALVSALILTGCGSSPDKAATDGSAAPSDRAPAQPPAGGEYVQVDGPLEAATLDEVLTGSDLVVLGTVTSVENGVEIGKSDATYRIATVEPHEIIKGRDSAQIEVAFVSHLDNGSPVQFEGQPKPKVGTEAVWFLQTIPPVFETDGYILASSASMLVFDDAGELTNGTHHIPLLAEAERLGTRSTILDMLEN